MHACVYVRVHDMIELDTVAELSSEPASTRSRINPVVIWDENREIINATAPSKFLPRRIGGKSDRETPGTNRHVDKLYPPPSSRRVPDFAIKRFEMCIECTQDVIYMKL